MSRLPKWANTSRQQELFARADIPALVPTVRHFEEQSRRRDKRLERTARPFIWSGLGAWIRRFDADDRDRRDHVGRQLTIDKIRECRHVEDLELLEQILAGERASMHGCLMDLRRVWTRAELGELLVETRNRVTLLRMGRVAPKVKGPRLDPDRIPLERLEALIQRHPDMAVVEQLRAARNRRTA